MPIKLPKGFQRRKSSGNGLDETPSPNGASTFRVIERPNNKSFDAGNTLTRAVGGSTPSLRPRNSFGQDDENLFRVSSSARPDATNRGSGGTEHSGSTAPYDSAASSSRLSVSTNPSSIDARSDRNVQNQYKDIPVPPPASSKPGFLRNSARTFSLGMGLKSKDTSHPTPAASPGGPPLPPLPLEPRGRAATASSASTATPRLFDSDLALDKSELNDFGNMFEGIGMNSRDPSPGQAKVMNIPSSSPSHYPPTSYPSSPQQRATRAPAPKPIYTNRNDVIEESPYSWTSQNSRDGLMRSPSPSKTITQNSPPVPAHAPFAVNKTRGYSRKPLPPETQPLTKEPSHPSIQGGLAKSETLNSLKSGQSNIDPAFLESVDLANQWAETKPSVPKLPSSNNKVMTPAQFEQYKRRQDEDRRLGASRDSDSEDEINYDDDEEEEKEREAAKQRRKQEAHLTVYRQQMMKVTGEQVTGRTSSLGHTLDPRASPSPNALDNRMSHLTVGTGHSGKSSGEEEDEDEDVPLGILAAHGFPNKNRPPTQIMHSSSNPNLRTLSHQQPQPQIQTTVPAIAVESVKRGSLPVFARHLPTDPYYGASVVNPMHRESLAIHAQQVPQGAGASTQHPLHPAGLVGVIAGEEKARAMRRGSPNAQANFDLPPNMQHPGMTRAQVVGPGPMPMVPGMGGSLTPGDHAQIQMSQQMTQMMQMQMQWMQQMQQMMGGQAMTPGAMPPGAMPMPPNFAAPPAPSTVGRPPTVQMSSAPQLNGRTMSTLTPSMASWNLGPQNGNYAASIAPSERSNVGLASRYRPVSTAPEMELMSARRASTFTSTSVRPWSQMDLKPSQNPRPSVSPVGRRNAHPVDDDDEEGWAEMKAKKDKKQKSWKQRKGQNALQELYNGVP